MAMTKKPFIPFDPLGKIALMVSLGKRRHVMKKMNFFRLSRAYLWMGLQHLIQPTGTGFIRTNADKI
jgi:hypothetical protein